eukprot:COSAG02_NODE_1577_length_11862_cov_13.243135_8_plen_239_part_00
MLRPAAAGSHENGGAMPYCWLTRLHNQTGFLSRRCRRPPIGITTASVTAVPGAASVRSMSSVRATTTAAPAVFVYGSLMHPAVVKAIIGRVPQCGPAVVYGHVRRCVIEEAYPACIRVEQDSPGSTPQDSAPVHGLLYHDCTERERHIFDLFEEIDEEPPMYKRVEVEAWPVDDGGQKVPGAAAVSAQLYEWVRGEGYLTTSADPDWSFEAFSQPAVLTPYLAMCREFVDEEIAQFYR